MLTFQGSTYRSCDGITRRNFLKAGALGLGGLSLADVLRARANGREKTSAKSVIMIYLPGGPSHIDMYDMKPAAPAEIRGEFKPISTNVPGFQVCELMPLQAKIADRYSVVHGIRSVDTHSSDELMRGFWGPMAPVNKRPVFGSIVNRLRSGTNDQGLPHYVALGAGDPGAPEYLGPAHKPFRTAANGLENLALHRSVSTSQLVDRKELLQTFDQLNRHLDNRSAELNGMDAFQTRALEMIASGKAREAFDISKEPQGIRELYGEDGREMLAARRLVEAGVSVVTLSATYKGDWDTHGRQQAGSRSNFEDLRIKLPPYDRCVHALITDLYERGLDKDVAVVIWGEFGRAPRINEIAGRHHWPSAGTAVFVGGGLKMGQAVGDTGARGEREVRRSMPYTPQNVLATLYGVLGIDPETTLPDLTGRPMYLLDEREPIKELL